jgi:hypothetical protein
MLVGVARAQAAATPLLPDLVQKLPANVGPDHMSDGHWAVSFDSEVINRGAGPFEARGVGPGFADMTASQWVKMSDGSAMQNLGVIGHLHYETAFDHQHWHFEPFDHYELRHLDGTLVGNDVKQGFCLGDGIPEGGSNPHYGFTSDTDGNCDQGHPEDTSWTEGVSPGFGDEYKANLEGQDIPIDPTTVPNGDYLVVHRVNENSDGSPGPVHESSFTNNVSTVTVHISWSGSTPTISATGKTCSAVPSCDVQPPPPPSPQPQPQPQPTPNPTPKDIKAPTLKFSKSSTEHFKSGTDAVFLYASCDEQCSLRASGVVSLTGSSRALRTGKESLTLPANTRTKVVLSLSRSLRKKIRSALAHHKHARVKVSLTVTDGAGNKTTRTRTITLVS